MAGARLVGGLKKRLGGNDRGATMCAYFDLWEAQHRVCGGIDPLRNAEVALNRVHKWKEYPAWIRATKKVLVQASASVHCELGSILNSFWDTLQNLELSNPLDIEETEWIQYQDIAGIGQAREKLANNHNQEMVMAVMRDPLLWTSVVKSVGSVSVKR